MTNFGLQIMVLMLLVLGGIVGTGLVVSSKLKEFSKWYFGLILGTISIGSFVMLVTLHPVYTLIAILLIGVFGKGIEKKLLYIVLTLVYFQLLIGLTVSCIEVAYNANIITEISLFNFTLHVFPNKVNLIMFFYGVVLASLYYLGCLFTWQNGLKIFNGLNFNLKKLKNPIVDEVLEFVNNFKPFKWIVVGILIRVIGFDVFKSIAAYFFLPLSDSSAFLNSMACSIVIGAMLTFSTLKIVRNLRMKNKEKKLYPQNQ